MPIARYKLNSRARVMSSLYFRWRLTSGISMCNIKLYFSYHHTISIEERQGDYYHM